MYMGMMMDEIEEEERIRRANDLAIARMLWEDGAAVPREFRSSNGPTTIAQGSSRTAASLSALRGGDDFVDQNGAPVTNPPAAPSTANVGRDRLFISTAPPMVGSEDPIVDDGYGHPSMDDVARIYDGHNPIRVTPPAPPVSQAPSLQPGPSTVQKSFHDPFPRFGQDFPATAYRPIDQPLPPLIQASSTGQAANQFSHWPQSQHPPLPMPGILSISAPDQTFPSFNIPGLVPQPTPASMQSPRTYSQGPPSQLPLPQPVASINPMDQFPRHFNHAPSGRNTPPIPAPVRVQAEPTQPQPPQWFNNGNNFRPFTPQPIPLEPNAPMPNSGNPNPMNPALDPYTMMIRNATQNATANATNATNDTFAQLFNNLNNPAHRTQQNTNTPTFSPTMWGTPIFPQPPPGPPVQLPPLPPTPTPIPPPIITQPANSQPSAPAQHPVQPFAQPPVQAPGQPPVQPPIPTHMEQSMQHLMQPPIQPAPPVQNPQSPFPQVPLPPQITVEATNRTTPQTPQLTFLPPAIIPAPPTIIIPNTPLPAPPSQAPVSQEQPSHTTISYKDRPLQSTDSSVKQHLEDGKPDLSVLVNWIPLLGVGGLVFYAFSNVGVVILAGVIVWYMYWVPAGHSAKK